MKCIEVEKQIDLMLDNELNLLQRNDIEQHCLHCPSCRKSHQTLQIMGKTLKKQPSILPTALLDRQILRAFENHHQPKETTKRSFWRQFLIPRPAFAAISILFAVGFGFAFLLGRFTSPEKVNTEQFTQTPIIKTEIVEKEVEKIVPQIVTVTKVIRIPVVRTKIVNKQIEVSTQKNSPQTNERETNNIAGNKSSTFNQIIQTKLNSENFRPVANIEIKVIKKGETNE